MINIVTRIVDKLIMMFNRLWNKRLFTRCHVSCQQWIIHGRIQIRNLGIIIIQDGFRCNSGTRFNPIGGDTICRLIVYPEGILSIGEKVGISNSTIVCQRSITIDDSVYIGGSCRIWDTDFHAINPYSRLSDFDTKVKTAPIHIRNRAFIGGGSIILKGVDIGVNSIVAAGSVVTKSIPDNEIWGGNPARFIRKLSIDEVLN